MIEKIIGQSLRCNMRYVERIKIMLEHVHLSHTLDSVIDNYLGHHDVYDRIHSKALQEVVR